MAALVANNDPAVLLEPFDNVFDLHTCLPSLACFCDLFAADRVGFEPTGALRPRLFSRQFRYDHSGTCPSAVSYSIAILL